MSTEEFLRILEESLSGELPANDVISNLTYYRDYIQAQRGKKSQEDTIKELGDPRLIARTIIETYQRTHGLQHYDTMENTSNNYNQDTNKSKIHVYHLSGKFAGIIILILLFLILGALFWIGGVIFKLFIKFVLPFLLIGFGISWIIRQIKR